MVRVLSITVAVLMAPSIVTASSPVRGAPLLGINLSGGEFRGGENGSMIPKPVDVQAYYDAGFRLFRLPFNSKQFSRPDAVAKWRAVADKCLALKVPCIFDRHEYKWPSVDDQVGFWVGAAKVLPASDLIHFDLMNEPKQFNDKVLTNNWEQWARDSRLIVAGLRKAGVKNRIWLEYPQYSGIDRFNKNEKRECISAACGLRKQGNINDPLGRTGVQAHRYFDKNGSGTSPYCDKNKSSSHFTTFARQVAEFGMPAMVGEAAFGPTAGCQPVAIATALELKRGIPNLYGVTWWGGGRAWKPSYLFRTPADPAAANVTRLTGR